MGRGLSLGTKSFTDRRFSERQFSDRPFPNHIQLPRPKHRNAYAMVGISVVVYATVGIMPFLGMDGRTIDDGGKRRSACPYSKNGLESYWNNRVSKERGWE